MSCPNCQTINGMYNKFCLRCQSRLLVDCPICYYANSVEAVVCTHCGANIREERNRRESWLGLKKQHDRRRREILAQIVVDEQQNEINRLLADLDEPERHPFAIFYLCKLGEAAVDPLINTLRHDLDPDARYASARALGMIGKPQAIPSLTEALSDPEPAVRYYAIDSLVSLKAINSRDAIECLVNDSFKWVYQRAAHALDQLDELT